MGSLSCLDQRTVIPWRPARAHVRHTRTSACTAACTRTGRAGREGPTQRAAHSAMWAQGSSAAAAGAHPPGTGTGATPAARTPSRAVAAWAFSRAGMLCHALSATGDGGARCASRAASGGGRRAGTAGASPAPPASSARPCAAAGGTCSAACPACGAGVRGWRPCAISRPSPGLLRSGLMPAARAAASATTTCSPASAAATMELPRTLRSASSAVQGRTCTTLPVLARRPSGFAPSPAPGPGRSRSSGRHPSRGGLPSRSTGLPAPSASAPARPRSVGALLHAPAALWSERGLLQAALGDEGDVATSGGRRRSSGGMGGRWARLRALCGWRAPPCPSRPGGSRRPPSSS